MIIRLEYNNDGDAVELPPPTEGSGPGDDFKIAPFAGFLECDPTEKYDISRAFMDAERLAKIPSEFKLDMVDCYEGICDPGVLEQRIWGRDIEGRLDGIKLIRSTNPFLFPQPPDLQLLLY